MKPICRGGPVPATLAGLLLGVMLLVAACGRAPQLSVLWDAPRFTLTDANGQPFGSEQLAGRVWLVNFIYTNCPDECPLYLSPKMMAMQREIVVRKLVGQAELVSLTVDPRRDTPDVLKQYGARYGADDRVWRFLTGPDPEIQALLQTGFKVGSAVPSSSVEVTGAGATVAPAGGHSSHLEDYALLHTNYFLLVDRQGRIRATYDGEQVKTEEMLRGVQSLLNEN